MRNRFTSLARVAELFVRPQTPFHVIGTGKFALVRLGRWLEDNAFGSPQALLIEFVGQDNSDPELNSYAIELQETITFTDQQFGVSRLIADRTCTRPRPAGVQGVKYRTFRST